MTPSKSIQEKDLCGQAERFISECNRCFSYKSIRDLGEQLGGYGASRLRRWINGEQQIANGALVAILNHGGDVDYILSGKRSAPLPDAGAERAGCHGALTPDLMAEAHARFARLVRRLAEYHEAFSCDPARADMWLAALRMIDDTLTQEAETSA